MSHMSQMRIFLSHSSADKDYCHAIVAALRSADADVWYDDHHLGTGQLLDEITRELAETHVGRRGRWKQWRNNEQTQVMRSIGKRRVDFICWLEPQAAH